MSFETKDSGERLVFESGMQRDTTTGKTDYALVASGPMFKRWAELLTRGAIKYERNNWMKASGDAELERFKESAFRHFIQWFYGETDEDHAAAVFFNINGAEYVQSLSPAVASANRSEGCLGTPTKPIETGFPPWGTRPDEYGLE